MTPSPSSPSRIIRFPPPPLPKSQRGSTLSRQTINCNMVDSTTYINGGSSRIVEIDQDVKFMQVEPVNHQEKGYVNGESGCKDEGLVPRKDKNVDVEVEVDEEEDEEEDEDEDEDDDMSMVDDEIQVHVEVRRNPSSTIRPAFIISSVPTFITESYASIKTNSIIPFQDYQDVSALSRNVERIWIAEASNGEMYVDSSKARFIVHVYTTEDGGPSEFGVTTGDDDDEEESQVPAASVQDLPSSSYEGLWDSLVYSDDIKPNLLRYIYSTMVFSEAEIDFNVISWNRMVLLHGPPGTGKTSLCRALAQKLSIRLSQTYTHGKLVEINSHSLFSKWFSESGKLVQKLFSAVHEMTEDEQCFVVVMIDEVESLTAARAGAMSGTEPSDAMRVVNALLTQLDKLKTKKNVLVMTTSNIAHAIDSAFVDRADIKQYIGLPPPEAVYWILSSCLKEIGRAGLLRGGSRAGELLSWDAARSSPTSNQGMINEEIQKVENHSKKEEKKTNRFERLRSASSRLVSLSETCQALGMSGRTLRKLPLLAHARYLSTSLNNAGASMMNSPGGSASGLGMGKVAVGRYVDAMAKVVADETTQRNLIAVRSSTDTTDAIAGLRIGSGMGRRTGEGEGVGDGLGKLAPGMVPTSHTNQLVI